MVQKRSCCECDGTGFVPFEFQYSVLCHNCNGKGFHEIVEKQSHQHSEGDILKLLHIVSKYTTTKQYEEIATQFNKEKLRLNVKK